MKTQVTDAEYMAKLTTEIGTLQNRVIDLQNEGFEKSVQIQSFKSENEALRTGLKKALELLDNWTPMDCGGFVKKEIKLLGLETLLTPAKG